MTKVVTANRLTDGAVVYVGAGGSWVSDLTEATRIDDLDAIEAALVAARADEARNLVVDVFVVDLASREAGALVPTTLRDRIRASGPTIHYGPANRVDAS